MNSIHGLEWLGIPPGSMSPVWNGIAPKTRADLARLVPPDGLIIELGVAAGVFAEELLTANPQAYYIGIDRWGDHHDEAEMRSAEIRLKTDEPGRATLIRRSFSEARIDFPANCADLIYVDGYAHTGQEGGETLRDWWHSVKPGGIFAGHDYDAEYPQTMRAVDAFVSEHGLDLNVIEGKPNSSWWLRKPDAK